MAKQDLTAAKKKPVSGSEQVIPQIFKVDQSTYLKVRTLAAARRGTGLAATGQDIYAEAVQDYLERHSVELEGAAKKA